MEKTFSYLTHLAFILSLSTFANALGIGVQRRADAPSPGRLDIPIHFGSSGQYSLPVSMATGSAAQNFNFTFSLGSGVTYAAGSSCQTCTGIGLYNQNISTTAKDISPSGNGSFITGSLAGPLIKETCTMKASNGTAWNYTNQTVIVVNDQSTSAGVPSDLLGSSSGVSGIVGLGTNRASASTASGQLGLQDSIFGQFFNRNPNANNFTFGMQLNRPIITPKNISSTNTAPVTVSTTTSAGTFHWLQPDPNAYKADQVSYKTTVDNTAGSNGGSGVSGDWIIDLDGWVFATGSTRLSNAKTVVASLETMYEDIYFPLDQATLLHAAIPGAILTPGISSLGNSSQAWIVPCNTQFSFGFVVGSQTFTLDPESLVVQLSDGTCVSTIEAWTDTGNDQYLLGARFVSAVYLIFTIGKDGSQTVGFAPLADQNSSKSKSNAGAIVGGVIGGVALLLIAAGLGFFFWKRYHTPSSLRAAQGQFDPDLTGAADKPEGPSAVPYTLGAPSTVISSNGNGTSSDAGLSPNTQLSFGQGQLRVSPGPNDPLLTADHPDVSPPAYEASESNLSGNSRPRGDVKVHLRNPSTGSAGPS